MFCARCGKENTDNSAFCSSCGTKLGEVQLGNKRQLSRIAGILDIVSAGLSLVIFLVWAIIWFRVGDAVGWWYALFAPFLLIWVVGVIVSIAGGIHALRRRSWGWAIAGAAAETLTGITLLGVGALILTAMSRDEFRQPLALSQNA